MVFHSQNGWSQVISNCSPLPVALRLYHGSQQLRRCLHSVEYFKEFRMHTPRMIYGITEYYQSSNIWSWNSQTVSPIASYLLLYHLVLYPTFHHHSQPATCLKNSAVRKSFRNHFTVKPHYKYVALLAERIVSPINCVLKLGHNFEKQSYSSIWFLLLCTGETQRDLYILSKQTANN